MEWAEYFLDGINGCQDVDVDNFKRCCTSYTFLEEYRVLIDLILHRSSINNSARLSNKFGGFYFILKFGISSLLHQVITSIADRIRVFLIVDSSPFTVSEDKRAMLRLDFKIFAKDKNFSSIWTYTTMMLSRVHNHHRKNVYIQDLVDFDITTSTSKGKSKLEYKFQDQENSEDIFSFGSTLEDFICVVFVPDRNINSTCLGLRKKYRLNLKNDMPPRDKIKGSSTNACNRTICTMAITVSVRYIDTRPNGDALRKCILKGPYTPTIVTTPAVPATEDSPAVPEQTTVETVTNMTPENRAHFESEKEAIHLILTGIGDEIYSTVDACQTAQEMWEAIERLQQVNVQFLQQLQPEWSRFVTIVKQQHKLDEVSYHKLFDILKQYQKEVNELRAERMAKNANPLATYFGGVTAVNVVGARETVGGPVVQQSGIQCFNCKEFGHYAKECRKPKRVKDSTYHKEKMLLCKQAEKGFNFKHSNLMALATGWKRSMNKSWKHINITWQRLQEVPNATQHKTRPLRTVEKGDIDYDKLEHKLNEALGLLAQKEIDIKEGLKVKAYEISVVKEKHDELVKQSLLSKVTVTKLSEQTEFVSNEIYTELLRCFAKLEKHSISLEIGLQQCQEQLKNDTVCKEKASNVFRKEREQYFEIQDLKAQLHDKNIAISELKKLIKKCKGKSVDTKFDKPPVVRQPNAQRIPKPSILGKLAPFLDSLKRTNFAKKKSVSKTNESEGLSKPVTPQNLPQTATQAVSNINAIKPGMYQIESSTTQTRAPQLTQTSWNTNPRVSTSTGAAHKTNVSRPQPRSNQMKDKVMPNTSYVKFNKTEVEEHPRISSISNQTKSVTACNDSLNSRTSNVNAVCATCGKSVFNSNNDACVSKYLNDVNARTKKPKVVPISTRKPKSQASKSVATYRKKTVASGSTITNSKSYYKMLYEKTNNAWKWWIEQQYPSGYKWVPKTKKKWVPKVRNENLQKRVIFAIDNESRITNIVQLILFIVDSGCTKHMTGNLSLLCNFIEKYLGTVRFGNDQFAPILGYGDLVQGNITINRVYYVEGLNHNLFSVGQFCNADLEVAFQKSTCFVRDLQGNDLLTDNRGTDLYTISLQEKTSSTPICLPTQAWLWHRRFSLLNFDYINLLSKKDVVIGLPKLKCWE
ncbi:retrovirus-related pol polyprotein from transposon TNT 1-94 [Tanacetum coccineum]